MRFASKRSSTWLAIEKYANVSTPVAAIPTESTRAPLAYERRPRSPARAVTRDA